MLAIRRYFDISYCLPVLLSIILHSMHVQQYAWLVFVVETSKEVLVWNIFQTFQTSTFHKLNVEMDKHLEVGACPFPHCGKLESWKVRKTRPLVT